MEKTQRHRVEILQVLSKLQTRAASARITRALEASGHPLSERTVRLYLRQLEQDGLTESQGRQGHLITEHGLAELRAAHVVEGVGFLSAKIDQMTFNMSFDLATRTGSVVVNVSLVDPRRLAACAEQVCEVFAKGYAMGNRVALLAPGETVGQLTVPPDRVGFCTICSITLNGVLLKHGIPDDVAVRRTAGIAGRLRHAICGDHLLRRDDDRPAGGVHSQRHDRLPGGRFARATA